MAQQIFPIMALLLGSAFLLFAGGVNALILPVRGSEEGFSALSLGLLGTGWAVGYVLGCVLVPKLVARVGHIRSFSVMAALAGLSVLLSLMIISPWAWIPLRALSGFCFSGAAMIVEGWLSERTDHAARGRVFGMYMTINLVATTAGQMSLMLGDPMTYFFFVLAAMFYIAAVIPTAVSSSASPSPLVQARLDIAGLYRNSPVAVVAIFFVGFSNGSFGALSAVYATGIGLSLTAVALFASLPILAGAVAQIPLGMLSDRVDRRVVLVAVAIVAIAADLTFILAAPDSLIGTLLAVSLLGAAIFAMYPVLLAHANDHAPPGTYVLTSGGLLLVFGFGSIVGPFVAGLAMEQVGLSGLFMTTAVAHVFIISYALWRIAQRQGLSTADKGAFIARFMPRSTTPQTAVLAQVDDVIGPDAPQPPSSPQPVEAR